MKTYVEFKPIRKRAASRYRALSTSGRQGPSESVGSCGDRATAPYEYICTQTICPKLCTIRTQAARRCTGRPQTCECLMPASVP